MGQRNPINCTGLNFNPSQVMFRAGRLAALEEIREEALSVIVIKMQTHMRRVFVKTAFAQRKAQK